MNSVANFLSLLNWGTATWIGLATFIVYAIIKGALVPRRTHEDMIKDRDIWRKAAERNGAARSESEQQVRELLELARTTNALLQALPKARSRDD